MRPSSVEHLTWDSDFFGFSIGRLSVDSVSEFTEWHAQRGVVREKLVYVFSKVPLPELGNVFKLVDEKRTYSMQFSSEQSRQRNTYIQSLIHSKKFQAELETLTLRSGIYSRFKLDINFPKGSFERFYLTWLENSQKGLIADELLGFIAKEELLGFITLACKEEHVSIGLIAVAEQASGKGIGKMLLQAAKNWALEQGKSRIEVVTQGQNTTACKFYEAAGYSLSHHQFVYHYWL